MTRAAGSTAVTLMGKEVAGSSPLLAAWSLYPLPTSFRVSPENVASPLTVAALSVPPRMAPPGLLDRPTVRLPANEVSTSP